MNLEKKMKMNSRRKIQNKMTIKNGELGNADDVMNLTGKVFKNQAQLLYNAARIGFNSKLNVATGVPNLKNIQYDCCLTDTASTKTGWIYDTTNYLYYPLYTDGILFKKKLGYAISYKEKMFGMVLRNKVVNKFMMYMFRLRGNHL